jgi:hypothetical protein
MALGNTEGFLPQKEGVVNSFPGRGLFVSVSPPSRFLEMRFERARVVINPTQKTCLK